MSVLDHYNWVVLGDHPGALLSASVVAKLGYSVLLLPLGSTAKASLSSHSQHLDPETNFILGLGGGESQSGLVAQVLQSMGGHATAAGQFQNTPGVLPQILTPEVRVSCALSNQTFAQELERELGKDEKFGKDWVQALDVLEPLVHQYWKSFSVGRLDPVDQIKKKKPLFQRRRSHPFLEYRTHAFKKEKAGRAIKSKWSNPSGLRSDLSSKENHADLLSGFWYAISGVENANPNLSDFLHLHSLAKTGVAFHGGMTGYRKFLLNFAKKQGVHIPQGVHCRRVFVENGKLIGIQVAERGRMVGVDAGIVGCALDHLREFLSASGRQGLRQLKPSPKAKGWKFTLSLAVHEEAIPPGMNQRVVWTEKGAPPLEIELADPADYDFGEKGSKLIFARTILPFTAESLDARYQRLIASRIFKQLTEIFPFLEYQIIRIYPDFREGLKEDQDEFSEAYGFVSVDMIPDNLRMVGSGELGFESGIPNLYVASSESFPNLGSLGASVAAIESAVVFAQSMGMAHSEIRKALTGANEDFPISK